MEFKQSDGMKQTNNGENRTTNCQDVARPIEKRKFVCVNPSVYSFVSISTRKERSKEGRNDAYDSIWRTTIRPTA